MRARLFLSTFVCLVFASAYCQILRSDQQFWTDQAKLELDEALRVKLNLGVAKNVILFVGDGMGPNTVTATRIYKGGESYRLVFEKFPHVGLLKTYSANKMVPDSACTATALFCGVKVNQMTIGVDASVSHLDCQASLRPNARLKSLAALAIEAGKSTGLVTTMRVTHATPSPLYAHSADRKWECETKMPAGTSNCKDIARQLVEDWPGHDLNVIMGGGRQVLVSNLTGTPEDPLDTWSCMRRDGWNLIDVYKRDKKKRGRRFSVVHNTQELKNMDVANTDYVLGVFANGHMKMEHERDKGPQGMPSISEMTEAAINVLKKNGKGFFLMIEGGNIDMAHHRGKAKKAISEAAAMEEAVKVAMTLTDEKDTLLIVTSDHTHSLNINGYPLRGSDIFGTTGPSYHDKLNYTVLNYGTGGPGSFKYYVKEDQKTVARKDPAEEDTTSFEYEQTAAVTVDENMHGGGDVVIYARGPYSHLFHNVHEQHYVYHAVSFAAQLGTSSRAPTVTAGLGVSLICLLLSVLALNRLCVEG